MKRLLRPTAIFALAWLAGGPIGCAATPGRTVKLPADLARGVLESLRDNRPEAFMNFALSPAEIEREVASAKPMGGSFQLSPSELRASLMENRSGMRARFISIRARAEHRGVHWPYVRFAASPARLQMFSGRIRAEYIDILFQSGGRMYRLRLDDCILTPRGWLMTDRMIWRGPVTPDARP